MATQGARAAARQDAAEQVATVTADAENATADTIIEENATALLRGPLRLL